MPLYVVREGLSEEVLDEMEHLGLPVEEVKRIWNEEDVPDIYKVGGAIIVDLQFLDHRALIILTKEVVYIAYSGSMRLIKWVRNVLKKRRKFLDNSHEFLYHAISVELEEVNEAVLDLHKDVTRREKEILEDLRKTKEQTILEIYDDITKLLDIRRELSYFYRMLVKLGKSIKPDYLEELRSSVHETLSLINLSLTTTRSLLDVHDRVLSMELNLLIKRLTAISIILSVLTIVTGIYGMNFKYIPLATHPLGFWLINVLMIVLFAIMWWWFKRIGWM